MLPIRCHNNRDQKLQLEAAQVTSAVSPAQLCVGGGCMLAYVCSAVSIKTIMVVILTPLTECFSIERHVRLFSESQHPEGVTQTHSMLLKLR